MYVKLIWYLKSYSFILSELNFILSSILKYILMMIINNLKKKLPLKQTLTHLSFKGFDQEFKNFMVGV